MKRFFFIIILSLNSCLLYSNDKQKYDFLSFKKVEIENVQIYKEFILDTGSNISLLDISIFNQLTLKKVKSKELADVLGAKKRRTIYKVKSLFIDDVEFFDVSFMVINFKKLFPCAKIRGIIGTNVLKKCIVEVDFKEKNLRVIKTPVDKKDKIILSLKIKHSLPYLKIKINNKKYKNCLLDLGDVNDLTLRLEDYENFNNQCKNRVLVFRKSMNNNKNNLYKIPIIFNKQVDIDNLKVNNTTIIFTNHKRAVGLGSFWDSKLILDIRSKQVYLHKKEIRLDTYTSKFSHLIKLDTDLKGFYIYQLSESGVFRNKYKINVGDYVERINNFNLEELQNSITNKCNILKKLNIELKKDTIILKMSKWEYPQKITL